MEHTENQEVEMNEENQDLLGQEEQSLEEASFDSEENLENSQVSLDSDLEETLPEIPEQNAALMRDSHNVEGISTETPPQQQDYEAMDEGPEEWDLHPNFPEEQDLLYPGQEMLEMELDYLEDEKQEDKLWQARTGLNPDTLCGAIETVIFMSDKPVAINKIKALIDEDMPLRVIHESITRLQEEYECRHHGLRLVEVAEGYQFRTKATFSKYVQDLFKVNSLVLSPTALEVLAIVAYKQPVAKTEVDKIRGVDSGHIVRGLIDKRLVRVVGRSDEMGRPVLYGTTPEFLEVFNLANLDELPPEHELEETIENNIGKISDIKTIVHDGDKERFVFDDIDELDGLADSIKEIASDTDFTNALKSQEKAKLKAVQGEEASEESAPRTAFDILEEYVSRQIIVSANTEAGESEMMTTSADPQVISDLTAGPFNVPEPIEEEEDDFQMIDLDTGLPIEDEYDDQEEEIQGIDLLNENPDEAEELARALDDAFEKLTGEKLLDDLEGNEEDQSIEFKRIEEIGDELSLRDEGLEEKEEELLKIADKIFEEAKDLDLDLDFLKDFSSLSDDSSEEISD